MIVLSKYSDIENYSLDTNCNVTLKVITYCPNNTMLFINCKTQDEKNITCCGLIALHNHETKVHHGDILEFKNVQLRTHNKSGSLQFRIHEDSTVSLINYGGSKKQIIPRTSSSSNIQTSSHIYPGVSRSVIDLPTRKSIGNEKIIGTIQNEFVFEQLIGKDPDFKHGVYMTTLLLFTGEKIRLIISKDFGHWPAKFLGPGEVVSVIGEKMDYYGMEARFVKRSDHLDVASDDEISFARKLKVQPRSQSIGRQKKVKFV